MTDYAQPDFYRFNEDSLRLVKWVLSEISSAEHILDLGAGSGVIGIELARVLRPSKLTLLELQREFIPFLKENCELFIDQNTEVNITESSFGAWRPEEKSDLIVSNPPYFLPGHGERSQDERKGLARSFLKDDWATLLQKIDESLSDKGQAFLVIRKDNKIISEIEKANRFFRLQRLEEDHLYFLKLTRLDKN